MSRTRRIAAVSTGGALLLGMLSACAQSSPFTTVKDFLVAWQVGNYEAAAEHTTGDEKAVARALQDVRTQLDAASLRLRLKAESTPGVPDDEGKIVKTSDTDAQARFQIRIDLGENGRPLEYQGQMALRLVGGIWKVVWSPSVIHPDLREGERLAVVNESPRRAVVQDRQGQPLLETVKTDVFGVVPDFLHDIDATVKRIGEITDQDRDRLKGRILSAPPRTFLQLAAFPQGSPQALKLRDVAGLQVKSRAEPTQPLQAEELVGRIGPATTDILSLVGAPYQPGDTVGTSGLQLLFQRRLAGLPSVKVVILDAEGQRRKEIRDFSQADDGLGPQSPNDRETAEAGPVRTTLDRRIQFRAENALASLGVPASLVTVRSQTGEVLAAANHNTDGQNRAFEGLYAPGTTFSTVLAAALISGRGQKADTEQECAAEATVGGAVFTSSRPRADSSLGLDVANGCRTALAQAGAELDAGTLGAALEKFGLSGPSWNLSNVKHQRAEGLAVGTATERAQLAVGEGGVKVSPLTMALIAGAVQNGTWKEPFLIQDPAPTASTAPRYIEPATLIELQNIMRMGVRNGSAKAAASGRKKFREGLATTVTDPQGHTVSWFIGYYQDYGIALAVEGPTDAAKIASNFINASPTPLAPRDDETAVTAPQPQP